MSQSEILVLGGGLAGAAAACTLARAGCAVTLLERDLAPKHKVCGEFLSGEALQLLESLGVSARALGAVPVRRVRLCFGKAVTENALPFPAMSLTRLRLDAAMLAAAEEAGVKVCRGVAVESFARLDGRWHAQLSDGSTSVAEQAVLATGKHDLRGRPRPRGVQSELVALKMYWRLAPAQAHALQGSVELLLHPGGYTGLQSVEDGLANLSALVERRLLNKLGGWKGFLALLRDRCAQARERLEGAEAMLPKPLAISAIPYGFVRRHALDESLWAVGDQAAVIPSFTGDGMSVALYSGVRAAESLLRGQTAEAFQQGLRTELRWQVAKATALSLALVREPSKRVLVGAVRLWPGLLRGAATATRLPMMPLHDLGGVS